MDSYSSGILWEDNAVQYLLKLGYKILHRRYKTKYGEIDIIAEDEDVIVFVETKFRKNMIDGLHSISERQKQRIYNAAKIFIAEHDNDVTRDYRFDAIIFDSKLKCTYIKGAFD